MAEPAAGEALVFGNRIEFIPLRPAREMRGFLRGKVVSRQRGDGDALQAAALMQQGLVIDLDATLAIAAAKAGTDHKLPLADSIVYATGLTVDGVVWTQDEDLDGLANVKFFAKSKGA